MPETPSPDPGPTLDELIERSRRLREKSDQLNKEMRELERLILAAAKARGGSAAAARPEVGARKA